MNETITATNIGPVERAEIPLDPEGGVTVLRGFNGCGKDTAIEAVAKMLGGKQSVPCSDGAARGIIEGLGVRVSIGKTSRRTGECEAVSLTGKFDLSEFVEPREKDPEAADRKRIKALLAIRGVGPCTESFSTGFADAKEFHRIVSTKADQAADLVEQARLVKADFETESRKLADRAQREAGHAEACKQSAEGVDLTGESDAERLQAALERALRDESTLETRQDAAERAAKAADAAQAALEKAKAEYTGPTLDDAEVAFTEASRREGDRQRELEALREQVRKAETALLDVKSETTEVEQVRDAAYHHESMVRQWQTTIDADRPEPVPSVAFAAASEALTEARGAIERGVLIREAKAARIQETEHTKLAGQLSLGAARLRDAAKATDTVLSDAVASETLWIENGRMMVKHPKRGKCPFGDLSKGEAWRTALLEAVRRIREIKAEGLAVIPIPQHSWEGLDPENRALIADCARDQRVNILTAEAANGELRAETYKTPGG